MGEGALSGMPLQLAGTRKILEFMDWGEYGALGTFVKIGSIGLPLKANFFLVPALLLVEMLNCLSSGSVAYYFINWVGSNIIVRSK